MTVLTTMPASSWNVICENASRAFWRVYTFSANGLVRWEDENNGLTGTGTWKISDGALHTSWYDSPNVETWDLPIDTENWTGTCIMRGADYDLSASARNWLRTRRIQDAVVCESSPAR